MNPAAGAAQEEKEMTTARNETARSIQGWLEVWANTKIGIGMTEEIAGEMMEMWLSRALEFHGAPAMVIPSPALAAVLYDDEPVTAGPEPHRRIVRVDHIEERPLSETPFDPNAPPIWEVIDQIGRSVPEEEWKKVPIDLAANIRRCCTMARQTPRPANHPRRSRPGIEKENDE